MIKIRSTLLSLLTIQSVICTLPQDLQTHSHMLIDQVDECIAVTNARLCRVASAVDQLVAQLYDLSARPDVPKKLFEKDNKEICSYHTEMEPILHILQFLRDDMMYHPLWVLANYHSQTLNPVTGAHLLPEPFIEEVVERVERLPIITSPIQAIEREIDLQETWYKLLLDPALELIWIADKCPEVRSRLALFHAVDLYWRLQRMIPIQDAQCVTEEAYLENLRNQYLDPANMHKHYSLLGETLSYIPCAASERYYARMAEHTITLAQLGLGEKKHITIHSDRALSYNPWDMKDL